MFNTCYYCIRTALTVPALPRPDGASPPNRAAAASPPYADGYGAIWRVTSKHRFAVGPSLNSAASTKTHLRQIAGMYHLPRLTKPVKLVWGQRTAA
jgi:hypothetical protein